MLTITVRRNLDWFKALVEQLDVVFGYLFLWIGPQETSCALGTRLTPRTLKQYKTKLQNLLTDFLKRTDIKMNSPEMTFTMNQYRSKQNMTSGEAQGGNQGDRERKAFSEEDLEKMDRWMTRPLQEVPDPEDLVQRVAILLLAISACRGTHAYSQIRRSYINFLSDPQGQIYARIKGNVIQKTNQGRSVNYEPLDKMIYGKFEASFRLLNPLSLNYNFLSISFHMCLKLF